MKKYIFILLLSIIGCEKFTIEKKTEGLYGTYFIVETKINLHENNTRLAELIYYTNMNREKYFDNRYSSNKDIKVYFSSEKHNLQLDIASAGIAFDSSGEGDRRKDRLIIVLSSVDLYKRKHLAIEYAKNTIILLSNSNVDSNIVTFLPQK